MRAGQRKTRASLPHTQAGIEDISYLNLGEVRNRLERNERVLNTSLFSTSPPISTHLGTSPNDRNGIQPNDPFREKLLRAREALLTREKELIMEQRMGEIKVENGELYGQMGESSAEGRRRSSAGLNHGLGLKSGKARAMEEIQASEVNLHPNGIILPYATTLALGERDYDNATINKISQLNLNPDSRPVNQKSKEGGGYNYDPNDEIQRAEAQARMARFMNYKSTEDDMEEQMFEDDWTGQGEGEYDGDQDRFELAAQGREPHLALKGTGEEVDDVGENDEDWAEGNDDYLNRV